MEKETIGVLAGNWNRRISQPKRKNTKINNDGGLSAATKEKNSF